VVLCKFTYFPLLLLLLVTPIERFSSKKQWRIFISCSIIIVIFLVVSWNLFVQYLVNTIITNPNVIPGEQIHFIINNPFYYLYIMTKDLFTNYATYIIQTNTLGWLQVPLVYIQWWSPLFLFVVGLLSTESESLRIDKKQKIIMSMTWILVWVLISTALYITWTPVGVERIDGIQGRYFIPLLPILLTLLSTLKISHSINKIESKALVVCSCFLTYTVWVLITSYYI
jgi:uncharacterized membrane protein